MDVPTLLELGFKPAVATPTLLWRQGERPSAVAVSQTNQPLLAVDKRSSATTSEKLAKPSKPAKQKQKGPDIVPPSAAAQTPTPEFAAAPLQEASVFPAVDPLPRIEDGSGFTCMSYNVLLPNSKDGWWIYKYYRDPEKNTSWTEREALLKNQILKAMPDIVCLQETSELSFTEDFAFLADAGYEAVMHEKGRMRPATFWRADRWAKCCAQHKDRTLVIGLHKRGEAAAMGNTMFVVNAHLAAGPSADRRLRQMHEALETIGKEAKKLALDASKLPVVVCGDFNSQGKTAVRELLTCGEVRPEFRESGDPTEKGQEGVQITSKVRRQAIGPFADAAETAYAARGTPATILATNIDSKMLEDDGTPTAALTDALRAAFHSCCSAGQTVMKKEDVERYLLRVNRELGRGSEYRFALAVFERSGCEVLEEKDFFELYFEELKQGKFWGVEHDLRALGGTGLAVPSDGPTELRFDYIFFTRTSLRLLGVQEPLEVEQRQRIWGAPWDVLPNEWHPSDHLPVAAAFSFV